MTASVVEKYFSHEKRNQVHQMTRGMSASCEKEAQEFFAAQSAWNETAEQIESVKGLLTDAHSMVFLDREAPYADRILKKLDQAYAALERISSPP